jgi:hypothetical protein
MQGLFQDGRRLEFTDAVFWEAILLPGQEGISVCRAGGVQDLQC